MSTSVTANNLAKAIHDMQQNIEAGTFSAEHFRAVADAYGEHILSFRRPSLWERFVSWAKR